MLQQLILRAEFFHPSNFFVHCLLPRIILWNRVTGVPHSVRSNSKLLLQRRHSRRHRAIREQLHRCRAGCIPLYCSAVRGPHLHNAIESLRVLRSQCIVAWAKGGIVLEADTLKSTTLRRSSRSKAKTDEHTLQKTERLAAKKTLNLQVLLLPVFQILVLFRTLVG